MIFLDELQLQAAEVGYGTLGRGGSLGYEQRRVSVHGRTYSHAFSAHPPSRVVVELAGRFAEFECLVALNDDVARSHAYADFVLRADDRVVAVVPHLRAGAAPHALVGDVRGCQLLELVVETDRWECCHAVWLDPCVREAPTSTNELWTDSLQRVAVAPIELPRMRRCIATVASSGYAKLLDTMLGSLDTCGRCSDATVVVFNIGSDSACAEVAARHGAYSIACVARAPHNPGLKSVLYSVATLIDAEAFLCLDADTVVLGDVRPLFETLDAYAPNTILIARDAYLEQGSLQHVLINQYRGQHEDLRLLLGNVDNEQNFPLIVNDGVFVASRRAMLGLDACLRMMPQAIRWVDRYPDHGWRNQFVLNAALAHLNCAVELSNTYNLQVHVHDVVIAAQTEQPAASWHGSPVQIVHCCGWGRAKHAPWQARFATNGETE